MYNRQKIHINFQRFDELVDSLAQTGRGVIMTMGKGGVGKTTIAASLARALAARGHRVHLTTTDPAAHVAFAIGASPQDIKISRIDPKAETRQYADEVLATVGTDLDEAGRALLEEDLRSPCTEEIAVFRAFAREIAGGEDGFGCRGYSSDRAHSASSRRSRELPSEVSRNLSDIPEAVRQLLPRLRDSAFTRVLLVTLPEATPVHEAAALQEDLRRARIEPCAWVINQSLTPHPVTDPVLAGRRNQESRYLQEVANIAGQTFLVPWLDSPDHLGAY
jgi:arsenite/tail-anchored protein-transporting ATPase